MPNESRTGQFYSDSELLNHRFAILLLLVECTLLIVKRRSFLKLSLIQVSEYYIYLAGRSEDVVFHNDPPYCLRTRRRSEGTLASEVTF